MATDLSVLVNTVKTHVRAIYAKLGINTRRAAVVAARQLGIDCCRIARLSGGRIMCGRFAARPTWRSSATVTKYRSARRSTPTRYPRGIRSAEMVLDIRAAAGRRSE
jgi:hypothetical protein